METEAAEAIIDPAQRLWWAEATTRSAFNWKRTSLPILAFWEERILSSLTIRPEGAYIPIRNGTCHIWTLSINARASGTPLVLLHGMGSGVALWVLNLEALGRNRPVYAIDLLGFGRSTRSKFSVECLKVEQEFVSSIEDWRRAMKLDKMILLGHSLGGYLATCYAIRHPDRIKHLILADPWGFPERPATPEVQQKLPMWARVVRKVIEPFNPFAMLRMAGPWGPTLVIKFRGDLIKKFEHLFDDARIGEYLYHCNAQTPSGETAFKSLTYQFGWAKYPMVNRVEGIPAELSMTMIYGSRSWVDYGGGYEVKYRRADSYVDVEVIREAGHHVYADKPDIFNALVTRTCDMIDRHVDVVLRPRSPRPLGPPRTLAPTSPPDLPLHLAVRRRNSSAICADEVKPVQQSALLVGAGAKKEAAAAVQGGERWMGGRRDQITRSSGMKGVEETAGHGQEEWRRQAEEIYYPPLPC